MLRQVREHEHPARNPQDDALLVHRLPVSYFSVKTGTPLASSNVPLRKWAIAIYLCLTSLKSVSSMKLHRDLKVSQKTAWFMLHRIREAWMPKDNGPAFSGPVEVDETYFGGKRKPTCRNAKRKELAEEGAGRGAVGKTAVVGAKDRATNQVSARVDHEAPTSRPCRGSSWTTRPLAQPSTAMKRRPTRGCRSRTKRSSTRSPSTSGARRTRTGSSPSGQC